jgi:hypothetical protein
MDGSAVMVPLGPYETATVRVRVAPGWSPLSLGADKDGALGVVRLSWAGGNPPYTLERADDPGFTLGVTTVVDEQSVATADDPVLSDGRTWYYRVR